MSTAKKGYSGVAVLASRPPSDARARLPRRRREAGTISGFFTPKSNAKTPMTASPVGGHSAAGPSLLAVWDGFGDFKSGYASEGRVLTMEYDRFFLVVAYVPNSGMRLDRLDYRVDVWDVDFRAYLAHLDAKKPVVFGGDLNVGHLDADIYNVSAPHVKKSAGLTPRERESWSATSRTARGSWTRFVIFIRTSPGGSRIGAVARETGRGTEDYASIISRHRRASSSTRKRRWR